MVVGHVFDLEEAAGRSDLAARVRNGIVNAAEGQVAPDFGAIGDATCEEAIFLDGLAVGFGIIEFKEDADSRSLNPGPGFGIADAIEFIRAAFRGETFLDKLILFAYI